MANRLDWNALEQKINVMMNNWQDIDSRSKSLLVVAMSTLLDLSTEEAIDAITDGGNDRGVDAIFVDDRDSRNDVHIFQSKCVNSFQKSKNNFPGTEVDKMTSFVSDLLNENFEAVSGANHQLRVKFNDAVDAIGNPGTTVIIHFIGNQRPLIESALNRINATFSRYNDVEFKMHDLDSLSELFLAQGVSKIDRRITVIDTNFFDRSDLNVRALVCTVSAKDIVEMIKLEDNPNEVELAIFDQNVRIYLKRRNRINRRIIESALSEHNHMFWYQNNGITITCDKMEIAPARRSPSINMRNIQIVNGGQTSNCLFEAAKNDLVKLEDVVVLLRIIETSSQEVKHSIAEATNSQTPINVRDLRSNDRQQRQLEDSFLDLGYYYERKANQFAKEDREKRIDALDAAQAYLAFGLGMPDVAKKDRGRIFGDLYDTVFSEELTVERLLKSYQLMKRINDRKSALRGKLRRGEKVKRGEISLIDGAFHVIFALSQMIQRQSQLLWDYDVTDDEIEKAVEMVKKMYLAAERKDSHFSSNKFFKDQRTRDQVVVEVAK